MRECEDGLSNIGKMQKQEKNCIYVVGHKAFQLPVENPFYVPLMVGQRSAEESSELLWDCTGNNIAEKNQRYNELTGLYWIWKNSKAPIVGICHYRRFFTTKYGKIRNILTGNYDCLLSEEQVIHELQMYDVILHNKTFTLEGNRNQLCMQEKDDKAVKKSKLRREILDTADAVFGQVYPQETKIYNHVMNRKYAHLLNVMICRRELLNQYCEWLFPLLFSIEKEIDRKFPNEPHERCMGLLGERLLDVWVEKEHLRVKECFTVNTERIDWKMW